MEDYAESNTSKSSLISNDYYGQSDETHTGVGEVLNSFTKPTTKFEQFYTPFPSVRVWSKKIPKNIWSDLVAGLTIAGIQIPQAIM